MPVPTSAADPDATGAEALTDEPGIGRSVVLATFGIAAAVALMLAAYTIGFAKPTPHDIPVAVVGPAAEVSRLDASPALAATRAGSVEAAGRLVHHRHAYGAIDLNHRGEIRLYTASGAGHSVAQALTGVVTKLAGQEHARVVAGDIVPTDADNPNGVVEFYCVIFLAIAGALGSTLLARIHGPVAGRRHFGERLALLVGYSAVSAAVFTVLVDFAFGALTGHAGWLFLALWGYTTAIALAAAGVGELFGPAAAIGLTLTFTVLGNTSAGGPIGRPLLPGFFSAMDPILPHAGGLSIVRGIQYFGGAGIAPGILCLTLWGLGGLLLLRATPLRLSRTAARRTDGAAVATPA